MRIWRLVAISTALVVGSGRTQRSSFPGRGIFDPPGNIDPMSVHGPSIDGALAYEILFPVENRKYTPSDSRLTSAGSWI
jgi:hypothetical protein